MHGEGIKENVLGNLKSQQKDILSLANWSLVNNHLPGSFIIGGKLYLSDISTEHDPQDLHNNIIGIMLDYWC